jgi:predicted RNase H-like nuclease
MALVLGIDAAWTETGSSGVALLECTKGERRIIVCAPSYASFIAYSEGIPIDWRKPVGGSLNVSDLLKAATRLGRAPIDVVAVDMPIARTKISKRRTADQEIATEFGGAWASTHSPTCQRPGPYGHRVTEHFIAAGFSLATKQCHSGTRSLIEVYPLAALVRLMDVRRRPPYKVARSAKYWPGSKPAERIDKLLKEWSAIVACLKSEISELHFKVPDRHEVAHLSALKPYEDALDGIISAYVGALFLQGAAEAHGDGEAAIWVPKSRQRRETDIADRYLTAAQETLSDWNSPSDIEAFRKL